MINSVLSKKIITIMRCHYFALVAQGGATLELFEEFVSKKLVLCPKPRTRYAIVPKKLQNWTLPLLFPDRWLDRMLGKRLGG